MKRGQSGERRRALLILLMLLLSAGATQLLVIQLARGAEPPALPEERFMLPVGGVARVTKVEIRAEALSSGSEVRLKDVARWSEGDGPAMLEAGELVVTRLEAGSSKTIEIGDLKQLLSDAGINLASINFTGSTTCRVMPGAMPIPVSTQAHAPVTSGPTPVAEPMAVSRTLREVLTEDLSQQLGLPIDSLQIRFEGRDKKVLSLREPQYTFQLEPRKIRKLGDISWDLSIVRSSDRQRVTINANARAWQTQVLAARPIAFKQELRSEDLAEKRILTDRFTDETPLAVEQAIGQSAARDISIGSVITGRMLEPPQCARVNQLINVTVDRGSVHVIWTAEARESGARGQVIRVRKPGTRDEFTVLLTGPEEGRLVGQVDPAASTKVAVNR